MKTCLTILLALAAVPALAKRPAPKPIPPLTAGAAAPLTTPVLVNGKRVPLKSLLAGNPNVVVFFPAGCATCDGQLQEVKAAVAELSKHGVAVFAVSPDVPSDQAATAQRLSLPYTLFSDPGSRLARQFGIVAAGAGGGVPQVALSAFLIGRDGTVKAAYPNLGQTPLTRDALLAASRTSLK